MILIFSGYGVYVRDSPRVNVPITAGYESVAQKGKKLQIFSFAPRARCYYLLFRHWSSRRKLPRWRLYCELEFDIFLVLVLMMSLIVGVWFSWLVWFDMLFRSTMQVIGSSERSRFGDRTVLGSIFRKKDSYTLKWVIMKLTKVRGGRVAGYGVC